MPLTGSVPSHPAEFSPEIIEHLRTRLRVGEFVVDPFAGRGERLGRLCNQIGAGFVGFDVEEWDGADHRVIVADSLTMSTWAKVGLRPFTVVTSPPYINRISTDYVEGPTLTTNLAGRRAYGISLGRALHPSNIARLGKPSKSEDFYVRLELAMRLAVSAGADRVLLNVDEPMLAESEEVLELAGLVVYRVKFVATRRYRVVGHGDKRPDFEVVIEAVAEAN